MSTTSIQVTLPRALKKHIEKRVREGDFTSPSDCVRSLVRAERAHREKRAALLRDFDAGWADIGAGRVHDGKEFFAELLEEREGVSGTVDVTSILQGEFDKIWPCLAGGCDERYPGHARSLVRSVQRARSRRRHGPLRR